MEEIFDFYQWSKNWEKTFKKSQNLLFVPNVRNIVEHLGEHLGSNSSNGRSEIRIAPYEKTLLKPLLDEIKHENLETKILKNKLPKTMEDLEQILSLLTDAKIKQHDVCVLSVLFAEINEFFNSEEFYHELQKHLVDFNIYDHGMVDDVTEMLMHLLLPKFSTGKIKTFPKDVFTKYFFRQKWTQVEDKIKKDETIKVEFDNVTDHFLRFGKDEAKKYSESNKLKKFLGEVKQHNTTLEIYGCGYEVVQKSIKSFESMAALGSISSKKPSNENIVNFQEIIRLKEFSDVMDSIFDYNILSLSRIIVFKLFDKQNPHQDKFSDMEFCNRYSDLIKATLYSNDENVDQKNFGYSVHIGVFHSICNHISAMVHKTIMQNTEPEKNHFKEKITRYILDELGNEENYKEKNIEIMKNIIHHFSFMFLHVNILKELVDLFTKEIFLEIQKMSLAQVQQDRSLILTDISEKILTDVEKHGCRSIPNTMPKQTFELLFKKLFDESSKNETCVVFCMIDRLDCNNKIFQMGNVTFYDGTKFDFGEGGAFDRYPDHGVTTDERFRVYGVEKIGQMKFEFKRNSGRAFVKIDAPESTKAIQLALMQVRDALSTLVYYSMEGRNSGFRSTIPSRYVVKTKTNREETNQTNLPLFQPMEIRDEIYPAVEYYGKLLQKQDRFDEVLMKGFSWYAKSIWEPLTQDRFLGLWIGLEQIFLSSIGQSKKKRSLYQIPELTMTWRKTQFRYQIKKRLDCIVELINSEDRVKNFLANNEATKNWKENYAVLLKNLDGLKSNTEETVLKQTIEELQSYLSEDVIKSIRYDIKSLRDMERFKIARLKQRRNSIVHQGETYVPELDIMTNALQKIFEDTIYEMRAFKHESTLEKIIIEANRSISEIENVPDDFCKT